MRFGAASQASMTYIQAVPAAAGLAMRMFCLLAALIPGIMPAASAEADNAAIVRLIDQWGEAVARCRTGDAENEACGTVHRLMLELDDLGWCYGHESDPGPFFRRWHRCEFESLHPPRP